MRLRQPLDDALATASHVKVIRALLGMPQDLTGSGREIARRAGVTHPTAMKVLRDLSSQGLVRATRSGGAQVFSLNRQNLLAGPIAELFHAEDEIVPELARWLRDALERFGEIKAAYLFGSAARGDMTRESDLDLAVRTSLPASHVDERLEPLIRAVRERVGVPVQLVVGSARSERTPAGQKRLWERIVNEGIEIKPIAHGRRRRPGPRQ